TSFSRDWSSDVCSSDLDPLDFDDVFAEIENTFDIKFKDEDLPKVNSFNDLSNLTVSYLNIPQIDSCTSQQAFYKFRRAYLLTQNRSQEIKPSSLLKELFPKQNRRERSEERRVWKECRTQCSKNH